MAASSPVDEPLERIGRTLVILGILVVAFACYQLWGTGALEWQAQRRLDTELENKLSAQTGDAWADQLPPGQLALAERGPAGPGAVSQQASSKPHPGLTVDDTETVRSLAMSSHQHAPNQPQPPLPAEGEVLGRIEIPSIGVSKVISQGVERDTLRQGPGHYPSSALPGYGGNVAIAGHRTTHGAPFLDLDHLVPGDLITVETVDGVFTYAVEDHRGPDEDQRGHTIVDPSAVEVIADSGDDRLTLTACHPRYSARQRIVVSALLVDGPDLGSPLSDQTAQFSPPPPAEAIPLSPPGLDRTAIAARSGLAAPEPAPSATPPVIVAEDLGAAEGESDWVKGDSLGWQPEEADPTVLWATVLVLIAHAGWVAGRLWRPRAAYLATAPVAIVPLFLFFVHLDRLLPAF
ncbi:MAG: class E sortase [Actinomycetia bacterium]|nr:class E sortase [Actinomycetes bacterium]